ncbi:MAG: LemA family protein [Bacteroidaceae bacterium]|nr:LemA family protein [Bacteroidaceae bacterium]MBO4593671.1 LemA family protein [Bacteroidaceae bacterium]MBR4782622.1 LemA family protein [Bacteroidaceae bacterium]
MSDTEKKTVGLSKKTLIILAVAAVLVLWGISAYNGMVSVEEKATTEWAKVQSSYQRRADLIPNLVNTVKGYATHEKETLEGVISARAKATSINIDASNLTPEQVQKYQAAQGELTQALGKLIAIGEAYPDLKANENFIDLQKQLEGTENRINEARNSFNKAVQDYNIKIRKFPNSLLAGLFGFDKMAKFEAEAGADKAPEVKF